MFCALRHDFSNFNAHLNPPGVIVKSEGVAQESAFLRSTWGVQCSWIPLLKQPQAPCGSSVVSC